MDQAHLCFLCASFYTNIVQNPVIQIILKFAIVLFIVALSLRNNYYGLLGIVLIAVLYDHWRKDSSEGFMNPSMDYHTTTSGSAEDSSFTFASQDFKTKKCPYAAGVGGISVMGKSSVFYGDRVVEDKYPNVPSITDPAYARLTYDYFDKTICNDSSYKTAFDTILADHAANSENFNSKYTTNVIDPNTGRVKYFKNSLGNDQPFTIGRGSDLLAAARLGNDIHSKICSTTGTLKNNPSSFVDAMSFKTRIAEQTCTDVGRFKMNDVDGLDKKFITPLGIFHNYFSKFTCA
jgi:hypothetical protein